MLDIHRQFETYFISVSIPFFICLSSSSSSSLVNVFEIHASVYNSYIGYNFIYGFTTLDILVTMNSMLPLLLDKFVTGVSRYDQWGHWV